MDAAKRTPKVYRWLDGLSGVLILFLVVWAPWALGCTIYWAVNALVATCYGLGFLLVAKWFIRWRMRYDPERWVTPSPAGRKVLGVFAGLTVLFLLWALIGAINGHSWIHISRAGPILEEYDRTTISWLPSSYDAPLSYAAVKRWAALALAFWAIRDWLTAKSRHEKHHDEPCPFPNQRLRWLLWTIALSSGALALVGILQRLDHTDKLLWVVTPPFNKKAEQQFATYAYRSNAAQYFNLFWPVIIAFTWALYHQARQRERRIKLGSQPTLLLLPVALLMAAVTFVTASRAAALLALVFTAGFAVFTALQPRLERRFRWTVMGLLLGALVLGVTLGGELLRKRFENVLVDQMGGREEIYETGRRMMADFGWRGSGADTFASLSFLYRPNSGSDYWAAYFHDDWSETLLTVGWPGLILAIGLLLCVPLTWSTQRGPAAPSVFPLATGMALVGLLVHAKVDLPFQVVSLQFCFLLLCAVLTSVPREAP